ncbi:hypothetical protein MPSEU_001007200 [Mayamaea pseudoterrestris]|nr:hypothetical protein MPSEU_001007200 [Mayamaea pseudoterrestris]
MGNRWRQKVEGAKLCELFDQKEADPLKANDANYVHKIRELNLQLFGHVSNRNWLNNYRCTADAYLKNKKAQGARLLLPPPVLPPRHIQPTAPDESEDDSWIYKSDESEELTQFEEIDSKELDSIGQVSVINMPSPHKPSRNQLSGVNGTFHNLVCGPYINEVGDSELQVRVLAHSGMLPEYVTVKLSNDRRSLLVLQRVPDEFYDAQIVAAEFFGPCGMGSAETAAFRQAVQQVRATDKEPVFVGDGDYICLGHQVEQLSENSTEIIVLPTKKGKTTLHVIKVTLQLPRTGYKTPNAPVLRVIHPYASPAAAAAAGPLLPEAPRGFFAAEHAKWEQVLECVVPFFGVLLFAYFFNLVYGWSKYVF